jgi:hypothetical protein
MLTPMDYFKLGDWATASPWLMIISSAEKMTQYYAFALLNAPPNTDLILVNVTVINAGSSTLGTAADLFKLIDRAGTSYSPLQFTTVVPNQFPWYTESLAPGETVSGNILYVVPNIASELSIVTFVNGKYLAWVLPW